MFATRVLQELGVAAPSVRVVASADPEWASIKREMCRLASLPQHRNGDLAVRVNKSLNRPHFLLFQFVKGTSLLDTPPDSDVWKNDELLHKLGNICAADVVLNNLVFFFFKKKGTVVFFGS